MTAAIHDFPADAALLAACREVLRSEDSTTDQIDAACNYLWDLSDDYCDLITVRHMRTAMAEQEERRMFEDEHDRVALRRVNVALGLGWALIAAAVAWRISLVV